MAAFKQKPFNIQVVTDHQYIIESIKSFLDKYQVKRSSRIWGMLTLFEEQVSKNWDNLPRTLIYHEVLEIYEIINTLSESPRVCQRLNNLRNWNYEKIKSLYIRIS